MSSKFRHKLLRAALVGAVVPVAIAGLAGSARADDFTTLAFGPSWTAVGAAFTSPSGDVAFLGYKFYDTLTSPVFTVDPIQYGTVCGVSGCFLQVRRPYLEFEFGTYGPPAAWADENVQVVVISGGTTVGDLYSFDDTHAHGDGLGDLSPWAGQQIQIQFRMVQPTWSNSHLFQIQNPGTFDHWSISHGQANSH